MLLASCQGSRMGCISVPLNLPIRVLNRVFGVQGSGYQFPFRALHKGSMLGLRLHLNSSFKSSARVLQGGFCSSPW